MHFYIFICKNICMCIFICTFILICIYIYVINIFMYNIYMLLYIYIGKLFPYGLTDPVIFDENLSDKRSTVFVLAVGRDGLPVAAKRMLLSDLTFPYAFEINDDDLVFPYTKEAYLSSEKRLDSVALTGVYMYIYICICICI
jgi:hypothetical protein